MHEKTYSFSDLFNALLASVALIDCDGTILQVNQSWCDFANANSFNAPGAGVGMNYLEIAALNDDSALAPLGLAGEIKNVLDGKSEKFTYEYPCHSPDQLRWFRMFVRSLRRNEKSDVIVIHMDITSQKMAEFSLRRQTEILGLVQDAIISADLDYKITYANRAAGELYGWETDDLLGRKITEVFATENKEIIDDRVKDLRAQGSWSGQITHKKKNGLSFSLHARWRLVQDNKGAEKIVAAHTDLSLFSQLIRAQRMQTIGQMAGGVAHDLNNILTPILLTAQEVKRSSLESQEELGEKLVFLTERAGDLIKQLLGFANGFEGQQTREPVAEALSEFRKILELSMPSTINIKFESTINSGHAFFNKTQLHQVLMNLCLNASDAMEKDGTISIESSIEDIKGAKTRFGEILSGRFLVIRVGDTGMGMTAAQVERSFEPFYTTKEFGKGTGLGLSTCAGILKNHSGFIDVHSNPGQGSTFTVYLPAESNSAGEKPALSREPVTPDILVLTDNKQIAANLRTENYQHIWFTADPDSALSFLIGCESPISKMVIDARTIDSRNDAVTYWEALSRYKNGAELIIARNDSEISKACARSDF